MAGSAIVPLETVRDRPGLNQLSEAALAYADSGLSENTRRAFRSSLRSFVSWCASVDRRPLPADAATVADYLAARAPDVAVSTLALHIAAIRKAHQLRGLPEPAGPHLDAVWLGIRKKHGRPPRRKRAITTTQLRRFVEQLPSGGLKELRDRAILLLGFAGALRRSELARISVDKPSNNAPIRLLFVSDGLEIHLDRSKGDQVGAGAVVAVPYGRTELCPVAALAGWITAAKIRSGPIFRRLNRRGELQDEQVSDRYVSRLVKSAARRSGLPDDAFGAHSLRSGLATEAAKRGVALQTISTHLRHSKLQTTLGYIREADRFKHNAAGKVGL